jgi:hypothetical protein
VETPQGRQKLAGWTWKGVVGVAFEPDEWHPLMAVAGALRYQADVSRQNMEAMLAAASRREPKEPWQEGDE